MGRLVYKWWLRFAQRQVSLWIVCCGIALGQLAGCIVPPIGVDPSVLSKKEMELMSHVRLGKDYASVGRLEVAEAHLRQAIGISEYAASIHNDLGYVLSGQERNREAQIYFRTALELSREYVTARENLAHTLYKMGELELAQEQYKELLDNNISADLMSSGSDTRAVLGLAGVGSVYRILALINYSLGYYDEALCYSLKSVQSYSATTIAAQHGRMLLSLDNIEQAVEFLRPQIIFFRDKIPPTLMLDYAIALYAKGDYTLARQAANKVLTLPSVGKFQRKDARVIITLVATHTQVENDGVENDGSILELIGGDNEWLCEQDRQVGQDYWPFVVSKQVDELLASVCNE